MSKMIEVPEELFDRLESAAQAEGLTPVGWMDANVPPENGAGPANSEVLLGPDGKPAKTLYDLFKGRIGRFSSGTGQPGSSNIGESFADYVEEKHRNGHL